MAACWQVATMLAVSHGSERRQNTVNNPGNRADESPSSCLSHDPATKSEGSSDVEGVGNFLLALDFSQCWEIATIDIWS